MDSLRVLVIDDSRTQRLQLRRMLTKANCEVELAEDGSVGLQQVRDFVPDLLLLDIQMPDTDGYQVCESLHAMGPPWNEIPIIFATSLRLKALSLLGRAKGAYLQKPFGERELLDAVHNIAQTLPSSSARHVKAAVPPTG